MSREVALHWWRAAVRPGLVVDRRAHRADSLRGRSCRSRPTRIGLAKMAGALADAGLDRVNVSLDTLDPDPSLSITRRDRLADVLAALGRGRRRAWPGQDQRRAAARSQRRRGRRPAAVRLTAATSCGSSSRCLSTPGTRGAATTMVTADEILASLSAAVRADAGPGAPAAAPRPSRWLVDGTARRTVGIIASVTRPFCGDCDRTRLTADGQVRTVCSPAPRPTCGPAATAGPTTRTRAGRARHGGQTAGHGIDDPSFLQPDRPMCAIGG